MTVLQGRSVTLRPLDANRDAAALWEASRDPALWTYLFDGPYEVRADFIAALESKAASSDPMFFAIEQAGATTAAGWAALMRDEPRHRVVEVGNILYTPALQRTTAATEAMYLLARHVFEERRYRRYEWKCDARNQPSRRAAERLGFTFEGVFRQHMIVKGQSRDTAWYSMLDCEWPSIRAEFERWLHPTNFDRDGQQRTPLRARQK